MVAGSEISPRIDKLKDAYYEFRGWDKKTGKPTTEKLRELGLDDIIKDLWGDK